jgi:hypothetical protein
MVYVFTWGTVAASDDQAAMPWLRNHPGLRERLSVLRVRRIRVFTPPDAEMTAEAVTPRHELWTVLDKCQMDIRAAQAKLTEARSMLAGMNLPEAETAQCPRCGIVRSGPRQIAEHVYSSHDGPLPEHWSDAGA